MNYINMVVLPLAIVIVLYLPHSAYGFGAGNIASIAKIEGRNWRHGDVEDILKTVAFIYGNKWTTMMVKRVYFGNWLRDYSQAIDVGTLKGAQSETIRILVWILGFMAFGYATEEFEVTDERLGTYRPEEHIDNPKDYADNVDARQYDARLRPPVSAAELAVDPNTGMKNYIANETGSWATSSGFLRHSIRNCVHYGRLYTSGSGNLGGNEADLFAALRYLGQSLHTLEDFPAHSNYIELALHEQGFHDVFPYTGLATKLVLHGKHVFPITTGTFGGVDFLHSLLGEATDHVAQSEVEEMAKAMDSASDYYQTGNPQGRTRNEFLELLSKVPGTSELCNEALRLQQQADTDCQSSRGGYIGNSVARTGFQQPNSYDSPPVYGVTEPFQPSPSFPTTASQTPTGAAQLDVQDVVRKIYPILLFRDRVARTINGIISKIPGLESLIENVSERITLFVMSLLAPYIKPVISAATKQLKIGSSTVVSSSAAQQFLVWDDPTSSDPTHSLLSKDHFSNILNPPAGQIAATILKYVAPRIIYAWENPNVPVDQVVDDCVRVFHHPAARDPRCEIQQEMFQVVTNWVQGLPDRGARLNSLLGSNSVRNGYNHQSQQEHHHNQHVDSRPGAHSHHTNLNDHSASPLDMLNQTTSGLFSNFLHHEASSRRRGDLEGDNSPSEQRSSVPGNEFQRFEGHYS